MARPQEYSDEKLLLDYLYLSNRKGRWLTSGEMNLQKGIATRRTYVERLGGLRNTQKLIIKNFPDLIEFNEAIKINWKEKTNEEILSLLISRSLLTGRRLQLKDIKQDSHLPSAKIILSRFGGIKAAYSLASEISEDFTKLPDPSISITEDERNKRNEAAIDKYIKACLERNHIIPIKKTHLTNVGFSRGYVYDHFGNVENFRNLCAKQSKEFAKLLGSYHKK